MEESTAFPAEVDKVESDKAIEETESQAQTNAKTSSKDFSPEERAAIIAKAKEVGTAKVSREFGIKTQLISYWLHQERKKAAKQSKSLKPLKQTTAKSKGKDSERTLGQDEHIAEDVQTMPIEPVEPITVDKPEKPAGRKAGKTVSVKVLERSDEKQNGQALIIENAILKERIALLNREIEKLRAALTNLM